MMKNGNIILKFPAITALMILQISINLNPQKIIVNLKNWLKKKLSIILVWLFWMFQSNSRWKIQGWNIKHNRQRCTCALSLIQLNTEMVLLEHHYVQSQPYCKPCFTNGRNYLLCFIRHLNASPIFFGEYASII